MVRSNVVKRWWLLGSDRPIRIRLKICNKKFLQAFFEACPLSNELGRADLERRQPRLLLLQSQVNLPFSPSFLTRRATTQSFCRNEYNVTGLCSRQSCPLLSKYATIREQNGVLYLYIKTPERMHSPAKWWEKYKLSQNYQTALSQVFPVSESGGVDTRSMTACYTIPRF
jgi:hypothetical protein